MFVYSDSLSYAKKILPNISNWRERFAAKDSNNLDPFIKVILNSEKYFFSEKESEPVWKYLFLAEHSSQSQYEQLIKMVNTHPGLPAGIICLAGSGHNFKGQRNRVWQSLPGNIHLSLFLKPNQTVEHFSTAFTILSAVSVIQTLDQIEDLKDQSGIKWVNDIYIKGCKVSGFLTQTQTQGNIVSGVFIGIGINVETAPNLKSDIFVPKAAALKDFSNNVRQCSQSSILIQLLQNISNNYFQLLNGQYQLLLDFYRSRSLVIGKEVSVYSDPVLGEIIKTNHGKVTSIGQNLELYLNNKKDPIIRGRIVLK